MTQRQKRVTEVDAYIFIKEELRRLGWDVRNPDRTVGGQVYTQNECLANPEIRRFLDKERPENIVKVTDEVLWVIEAKSEHSRLEQAIKEAEEYANALNKSKQFQVRFISGVAGNDMDSYLVKTMFLVDGEFVPIKFNNVEVTGLLSLNDAKNILERGTASIDDLPIDEKLFLSRANRINEILHLGAVNPHQRAGVMAALLLAMLGNTPPNIAEKSPTVLINDINVRVENVLKKQGKNEFASIIRIPLPTTEDNHVKLRRALVETLQELKSLNIRSAMNSGSDWLGAFYEVFLKYASWAQDLGIVLTPRHITRFVADVMDIQPNDIVYDPCCGTGGFLVAAFDAVKTKCDDNQLSRFKQSSLFGIEQDSGVAALAVVNMIFRGDGKNNIKEGNCFSQFLAPAIKNGWPTAKFVDKPVDNPPVTKVLTNPPFALKRSDEKEFNFIEQALRQMQYGGVLFSVLPYSAMVRPGAYLNWRKNRLLKHNTLLAVVTFPPDLFYPVGVTSVGIFVKKGMPHPKEQNVLWVRAVTDGLQISKGRRLPSHRVSNALEDSRPVLKAFLQNPNHPVLGIDQLIKAAPINFTDNALELVPEAYLDQAEPTMEEVADNLSARVRLLLAYLVKINNPGLVNALSEAKTVQPKPIQHVQWKKFKITDIFTLYRGDFHSIQDLDPGKYPTISRISTDNGFVGFFDKPEGAKVWPAGTITVSTVTGDAFFQPVPFIVTDNVVLCVPGPGYRNMRLTTRIFASYMIDRVKWRWSYGRQCYKTKFAGTEILLPVTDAGSLDEDTMQGFVENTPFWSILKTLLEKECYKTGRST